MPALQVRDCPDDLYEKLRLCAASEDRSMAQQTLHIVREYLREHADEPQGASRSEASRREAVFTKVDALPRIKNADGDIDIPAVVREMRDERGVRL